MRPPITPDASADLWRYLDTTAGGRGALACALGAHRFTLYRVAAGARPPSRELADKLATYLTALGHPTTAGQALDLLTGTARWGQP